nr:hypothetical protein [Tanacetum cinerariifolium]
MTKITDVEANLEQFKEETSNRIDRLQESIDKNKADADKQFAEMMQALKALQPSTTLPAATIPIPPPQQGTTRDYVTLFEGMAAQLPSLSEEVLGGVFIKGVETIIKNLNKKAKGLCFRCDGKFGPGHRCPKKSLHVLFLYEDDEEEADDYHEDKEHVHLDAEEVSMHSVVGITTPHTMKLRGIIKGYEVVFLIDGGATHNFLSVRLVKPLGLRIMGKRDMGINLGNGKTENSLGICRGMELNLQGHMVIEDFYSMELGSTDVILGVKWLRQLGETRVNWKELTMSFQIGDDRVTLRGEPGLRRLEASLQSLARAIPNISETYLIALTRVEDTSTMVTSAHPAALVSLLTNYSNIFVLPTGLPPQRDHKHAIVLKSGTEPINVRPYRYPQLQKDEIEKLVGEMLEAAQHESFFKPGTVSEEERWELEPRVEYLGHIVTRDGVIADPSKISAMIEWPLSKNIRELWGSLGLTGYYRKFVQGYGKIAQALTDLLKKDNFHWTDEATQAFQKLSRNENGAADALSRREGDYELSELIVARISSDTSLLQAVRGDSEIVELRTRLLNGGDGLEGYGIVDGDVRYKGRLPLNLPKWIWEELSMDFINGLPKSEGYSVIMVVVDRLSKSAHFIPLKHPYTATSIAVEFIRGIVRLHGIPKSIVSDRDRVFISHFQKELFKYQGTQVKQSTAYHPQTDGQTEVVNCSLETYLRCFSSSKPKQGVKWLPWAEYWVARLPLKLERDEVLDELKIHLRRAQQLMKVQADGKRRDVQFQVGDQVYLKLRPYRQVTVVRRLCLKLVPRFYGPFEIVEKVGAVAYRLKLPATAAIHPVFHVSQLKAVIGDHVAEPELPMGLTEDMVVVCKPVEVIETREGSEGLEFLVVWEGLTRDEATWERADMLCKQFPAFHLEDKVNFQGASNVTNQGRFRKVYRRRKEAT